MPLEAAHPNNIELAEQMIDYLPTADFYGATAAYRWMLDDPHLDPWVIAAVAEKDRFFLLTCVLRRRDAMHPWLYERCREVEAEPDDKLDLWARGHYKSTIITFAGSVQEIIKSRGEITIGIFSHTKPIAKAFLEQIKSECEENPNLPGLWPDIFYDDPKKESPSWSLDRGITVRRRSNPKEKTVEAWGLVDGQPTSKHYTLRVYDDVVTEESVSTPEMILKTTLRWELSQNLATLEREGGQAPRRWHIGTRYNFQDTYGVILLREALSPRIYPATDDGTKHGAPILLTQDAWDRKCRDESSHTIACQQLLNPLAGSEQEFRPEWIRPWFVRPSTLNIGILCDPAGTGRTKEEAVRCDTAFVVWGIDHAHNLYLLDGAIHKMNLDERWKLLKSLWFGWSRKKGVQVVKVGYERYGMQADIEHFQKMMEIENKFFPVDEVNWPRQGSHSKDARIRRLQPDMENWRMFFPNTYFDEQKQEIVYSIDHPTKGQINARDGGKEYLVAKPILRRDENNKIYNVTKKLVGDGLMMFPATTRKDGPDAASRIYDLDLKPPMAPIPEKDLMPEHVGDD